eukprot:gene8060-8923_t
MGIFSKFQIKDIKSKILGGRVKQQKGGEVPAISVIPPTPSAKLNFAFPGNNNKPDGGDFHVEEEKNTNFKHLTRQRSHSLPDCSAIDDGSGLPVSGGLRGEAADTIDIKVYLKPPRNGRRRRKNRKRYRSCPENLTHFKKTEADGSVSMKTVASCGSLSSSNGDGPNPSGEGEPLLVAENIVGKEMRVIDKESEESPPEKSQHEENICGISRNEYLCGTDNCCQSNEEDIVQNPSSSMDSSCSSLNSSNNGLDMDKSEQNSLSDEAGENTPLFESKSEKCEESGMKVTLGERIRKRVLNSHRATPQTRWSLDLERLLSGGNQKFSDKNNKWDGQSSDDEGTSNGKSTISTWSLDFDNNKGKINCEVERTQSEICVGVSPSAVKKSDVNNCEKGITNAKSLDLDLVSTTMDGELANSDTIMRASSLKKGINGYIGKFNGIVSKFSTWSLDMETQRKRPLDMELGDSIRARSETLLDEVETEPASREKSLSYHALLYDIDEASRYQIYQPTVYDIGDEDTAMERPDSMHMLNKPTATKTATSMRFISKQFEHLYENSKNLYKHRYAFIDALKQRERELKAIADRENAKALPKQTELIFKPKVPVRQRSHSYHIHKLKHSHSNGT